MSGRDEYMIQLPDKVDPSSTALVVIDYQNDFVADGGAFGRTGATVKTTQAIEESLASVIEEARRTGVRVIFVRGVYSTKDNEYLSRVFLHQTGRRATGRHFEVPVCEPDSWGGDFYGCIRPQPGETLVSKHRFDAFIDTDLDLILRSNNVKTVVITGVATDVCVESTVRHGFFRDYFIVLPRECLASYSHDDHERALARMDLLYGEVVSLSEVVEAWRAHT